MWLYFLRYGSWEVVLAALAVNVAAHSLALGRVGLGPSGPYEQVALGCAIWLIYALDRLGDAWQLPAASRQAKPGLVWFGRNARWLLVVCGAVLVAGLLAALRLPQDLVRSLGLPAIIASVAYLGAVQLTSRLRVPFLKEPWVAIVFSLGAVGPAVLAHPAQWALLLPAAGIVALLAGANLALTALAERPADLALGSTSLATALGPRWARGLGYGFVGLAGLTSVRLLLAHGAPFFAGAGLAAVALVALLYGQLKTIKLPYRLLADLSLMLPLAAQAGWQWLARA